MSLPPQKHYPKAFRESWWIYVMALIVGVIAYMTTDNLEIHSDTWFFVVWVLVAMYTPVAREKSLENAIIMGTILPPLTIGMCIVTKAPLIVVIFLGVLMVGYGASLWRDYIKHSRSTHRAQPTPPSGRKGGG